MSNRDAPSCGSLNPWLDGEQRFSEVDLVWQDPDHTTPFSAMADLIGNWPGSPQTSEWPIEERHSRLMQIIAGYPEVFAGRRPLDAPLHQRSRLAFKLSLFMDKIAIPTSYEWHSLRSALLLYDTLKRSEKSHKHHKKILHTMMKYLRESTKYIDSNSSIIGYDPIDPHPDEVRFLTLLHSQNHHQRGPWPIDSENEGVLTFSESMFPSDNHMVKFNLGNNENDFQEHVFKFMKIQNWIKQWAQTSSLPLIKNVAHNLIIGASVMLESTLAKLRSQVISEHGVGSITVDGGGRLSYLSQNKPEKEKTWFEEKLGRILLLDKDHPHPFQRTIEESIRNYAKKANKFIQIQVDNHNKKLENKTDCIDFRSLYQNGDINGVPKKAMYDFLLRKQYILECMPSLNETHDNIPTWENEACVMCNKKTHRPEEANSPNNLLEKEQFVCVFHYLLYAIGKQAQIRYSSRADIFNQLPHATSRGNKEVQQIVKFDGNCIGGWFSVPYSNYKDPGPWEGNETGDRPDGELWSLESNTKTITKFWNQSKKEILDPITDLENWDFSQITLTRPSSWVEENFEHRKAVILRKAMIIRRTQVLLRRQRRSFNFNAVWWSALQEHLHQAVPWVLAGDDITLVSSSAEPDVFYNMLAALHHELANEFPQTPITFAGGVCTRGDTETIRDLYERCDELEHTAGNLWKFLFADNDAMPHLSDEKRDKLTVWLNEEEILQGDREQLRSNVKRLRYAIGASDGINSLLLRSDWNADPKKE